MRPATMCAWVAFGQRLATAMSHVCVDWRVDPFGSKIVKDSTACCLLWVGAQSMRKWLVAPESLRANVICGWGGRIGCRADKAMSNTGVIIIVV